MNIIPYTETHSANWDEALPLSVQGTILQSRRFLAYHGDRFDDRSVLLLDEKDRIRGLFAAAVSPSDTKTLISHPGLTYAGLVHDASCRAAEVLEMVELLVAHYRASGFKELIWKPCPRHICRVESGLEDWALWRIQAQAFRCDLWNVADLSRPRKKSKGVKWGLGKARKAGVKIRNATHAGLSDFHAILAANLQEAHGTSPVHSLSELQDICERFPEDIRLMAAFDNSDKMLAGTLLFDVTDKCTHSQYIASTLEGREMFALNMLIEEAILAAEATKRDCFSFGASTEEEGRVLNDGLYSFKAGFGVGSAQHTHFRIGL